MSDTPRTDTQNIDELIHAVRLHYDCMADGGFVRCMTCGSQEDTRDMDIMRPLGELLAALDALQPAWRVHVPERYRGPVIEGQAAEIPEQPACDNAHVAPGCERFPE